ncbi:MAG TPA: hypothetical protein VGW10_11860, partial [Solirubrobacteraceae bacterium]|nr:hypothetical protein [Solirubrobacteraceae bacterium]
ALCCDGTSSALGFGERVSASPSLLPEGRSGLVVSTDLFYDPDPARVASWRAAGALAVEMETAALFCVGLRRGISVACVLAVSDVLGSERVRISEEGLRAAGSAVGRAGLGALLS